jgi:hypothetical protein
MTTVISRTLHRIQQGHGKAFAAEPPAPRQAVRRPARVAKMLALAHTVADAIASGKLVDQADAARRLGLTRARITQLLALMQLAPDLQEHVLFLEAVDGIEPLTERDLRNVTGVASWDEQRAMISRSPR